jgi:hypothetical protein
MKPDRFNCLFAPSWGAKPCSAGNRRSKLWAAKKFGAVGNAVNAINVINAMLFMLAPMFISSLVHVV